MSTLKTNGALLLTLLSCLSNTGSLAQTPSPREIDTQYMGLVQQLLGEVGHNVEPVDGVWGKSTEVAIEAFATDHNVPQVVSSTPELIYELMVVYAAKIGRVDMPYRIFTIEEAEDLSLLSKEWQEAEVVRTIGIEFRDGHEGVSYTDRAVCQVRLAAGGKENPPGFLQDQEIRCASQ